MNSESFIQGREMVFVIRFTSKGLENLEQPFLEMTLIPQPVEALVR